MKASRITYVLCTGGKWYIHRFTALAWPPLLASPRRGMLNAQQLLSFSYGDPLNSDHSVPSLTTSTGGYPVGFLYPIGFSSESGAILCSDYECNCVLCGLPSDRPKRTRVTSQNTVDH